MELETADTTLDHPALPLSQTYKALLTLGICSVGKAYPDFPWWERNTFGFGRVCPKANLFDKTEKESDGAAVQYLASYCDDPVVGVKKQEESLHLLAASESYRVRP